jgi:VanZ family protein
LTDQANPVYLQPRTILVWVITFAWAGNMSLFSTGAYSGAVTGWLLAQVFNALHIQVSAAAFATIHFLIRKSAHLGEYAVFCLLLYHSFAPRSFRRWNTRIAGGALLTSGLFSLVDEYHQSFVPSRTASLVDCGIDTAGALLALLLFYGYRELYTRRSSPAAENERKAETKKGAPGE